MELRVLNYFLVIAKEKNMTKAAKLLHVSQPALSKQIKELEQVLFLFEEKVVFLLPKKDFFYKKEQVKFYLYQQRL